MHHGWIVRHWVDRPPDAAADWPASELRGHPPHAPLALRIWHAQNIVGRLTLVTPEGLHIDGAGPVPYSAVRAYGLLHPRPE